MSKKGKLHTLSKYEADRLNHIAFMPREDKNIFNGLLTLSNSLSTPNFNSYNFGNYNFGNYKPFASSDIFRQYGINTAGNILSGYNTGNTGIGNGVFNSKSWRQKSLDELFPVYNFSNSLSPFNIQTVNQGNSGGASVPKSAATTDTTTKTTTGVTPAGSNMWKPSNETMQGWADNWIEKQKEKAYDAGDDDSYNKWIDIQNTPGGTLEAYKSSKNALGISKQANPFSKMNIGQTFGAIASAAPRELFDTLDPVYHLAGGRESAIGNGLSETGVGLFKAGAQSGNGALMLAGAGAKVLGGLWNGAFGAKWNKENIADVENNISNLRNNVIASAHSNDEVMDRWTNTNFGYDFDQSYIGKNGWLNHKATRKYKQLAAAQETAREYAKHNLVKAAGQADRTSDRRARSRFKYDEGGFLDNILNSDMGSGTKYLLASSDLDIKRQNADTRAKMASMYAGTPGTFFDEGGQKGNKWVNSVGTVGPGGFVPNNLRGTYGGGIGLGGGAGTRISDVPEYETTVQNDTIWIPVERTFNDAFREAVRNGQDSFMFNGELKNVEFGDNPKWKEAGDARKETVGFFPLVTEKKKTERKKAEGGPLNILCGGGKFFAIGGDMQTNGADFSTGLTHIDAGLSHEMNPNEGVQVGVDSEGTPNLVEEGEVIWNDYVFSNRIQMDNESKEVFHINKKRDITYADQAKRLEREAKERPNDPISQAAFNAQMEKLQEQQERQKAEMEAQRAQEAFAALSPEEQVAVMQQAQAQEQQAQEAVMQEQAIAEQQAMQGQPTPEEAAMMQQQQMMQAEPQMEQQQVMEPQAIEQPVMAYGGNLFPDGGALKKLIYRLTNSVTEGDFAKWAKANNINTELDWKDMLQDAAFKTAIAKSNPALAHAMNNNYDFGVYSPDNIDKATIKSIAKGNWTKRLYSGWKESEDPAWLELIDYWKNNLGDNWEQKVSKYDDKKIAEDFKKTSSYQNTNKWLQKDPENMRKYLLEVVSNQDSPEEAKRYARNFIDNNGNWIGNKIPTYAQVFGENGKGVRETFPGTYWHSVVEANRGNVAKNFVINDDGTIEEIVGDTPSDWKLSNTYDWDDPSNHNTYNYYKRAAAETAEKASPTTGTASKTEEQPVKKKYKPVLLPETKLGLLGPVAGLTMQAMNIGKPNFTELDKALAISNRPTNLATYQPVPGYLTYKPANIWAAEIVNNASARGSDRAIANANPMAAIAGHVANNYANQIANNDLYTKGLAYDDNERKTVFDANAGINMQNANAFNQLSQFNANELNDANNRKAYMAANIAGTKLDANTAWNNGYYGNVNALFKGIGDYEREVRDRNTIAKMVASGIYPGVNLENALYAGLLEEVAAEGGKIKRKKNKKRGLTI